MSYTTLNNGEDIVITAAVPFMIAPNIWGHKKTRLKNMFATLTDDDLNYVVGQEDVLVCRIVVRLHKSEAEVRKLITDL